MLDLDFAFFNMMNKDKNGLAYRKAFLDRLAPLLFGPRVENLVELRGLGFKGCNLKLPLGPGNWNDLTPERQTLLFEQSQRVLDDYKLPVLAVDRRLKKDFLQLSTSFPLIFGDNFIKALTNVIIRFNISARDINRLVVVGEMTQMPLFIEKLKQFDLPVSIQNYCPDQYEIMAYHMLYAKGIAVSTSYINPREWGKNDLVMIFDPVYRNVILTAAQIFTVNLMDESQGLAPQLEQTLENRGLPADLGVMAPVLESCLLSQAGFPAADSESAENGAGAASWEQLEDLGYQSGLWDYFLDKVG